MNYGDKIRLVFKNFPLSIHPFAESAAEAAMCAGKQGRFWQMHDQLFGNQRKLEPQIFTKLASEIGLSLPAFDNCFAAHDTEAQVRGDQDLAKEMGLQGTPTLFVNGRLIIGELSSRAVSRVIDSELFAIKNVLTAAPVSANR